MRKKMPKSTLVQLTIGIRVTADEYDLIRRAAEAEQRSLSNYARLVLVNISRDAVNVLPK